MPGRMKAAAVQADGDDDSGVLTKQPESTDADASLDAILGSLNVDEAYVSLRRLEREGYAFLARLDSVDANEAAIKEQFGGGRYRARIFDADDAYIKQVTFRIIGKPKYPLADDEESPRVNPVGVVTDVTRLDRLERMIETVIATGARSGGGNDIILEKVLDVLVNRQSAPSRDPLLEKMLELNMTRANASDPASIIALMETARQSGMEVGQKMAEVSSGGGENDGFLRLIDKSLPEVVGLLRESMANDRAKAAANPPVAPAPESIPQPKEPMTVLTMLRLAVPRLVKWAKTGKDAEIKADNFVDDLPEHYRDTLAEMILTRPGVEQEILAAFPELAAPDVQPFALKFFEAVKYNLTPESEDEQGNEKSAGENGSGVGAASDSARPVEGAES